MKSIFEPSDFQGIERNQQIYQMCANIANAKLKKLMETWPVVYGLSTSPELWTMQKQDMDTHRAHLAFIEELPKEPCKHEPLVSVEVAPIKRSDSPYFRTYPLNFTCRKCGVELLADWKENK
jgi:hypothetical protein